MSSHRLPDPVPLGVSGAVTIPLARYQSLTGTRPVVLLTDDQRHEYIAARLRQALDRPVTSPGSEGFARQALARFPGVDLAPHFAEKALETLRDGQIHNRTAISPGVPHLAILFVAWAGLHGELQALRYGNYLSSLYRTGKRFVDQGMNVVGILEIDTYLRDNADPDDPGCSLDETFEVEVEYSYLPGWAFGSSAPRTPPFSSVIMLNPDLCDDEERQVLDKLMTASSGPSR